MAIKVESPQLQPLMRKLESGKRNGVGKKEVEWEKMSIKMCSPQPYMSQKGLPFNAQTTAKTTKNKTKLWV